MTTPAVVRGGLVLVTCSPSGLADVRAFTDPGWAGRWAPTGDGRVTLWFSRSGTTQVLVAGCSAGVPTVRATTVRDSR